MLTLRRSASVLFGLLCCSITNAAYAAPDATSQAAAQALFDEARKLMEEKNFVEACPKFQESQRLDPGGGTLLNLAVCHEGLGLTATAWAEFNESLALAIRENYEVRVRISKEHIAALTPRLNKLVFVVQDPAPKIEVFLDGTSIGQPIWNAGTPIDPGDHKVTAKADGYENWEGPVHVEGDGKKWTVTIPPLKKMAGATFGGGADPNAGEYADRLRTRRRNGYIFLGVGGATLAAGAAFGLMTISKRNESDEQCPLNRCSADGVRANKQAITYSWISTAGFGAALLATGAGAYFLLTDPSKEKSAPRESAPNVGHQTRIVPDFGPGRAMLHFQREW